MKQIALSLLTIFIAINNVYAREDITNKQHSANTIKDKGFFTSPHNVGFADITYVSPMGCKNYRDYKNRINFYADVYGGPVVSFNVRELFFSQNTLSFSYSNPYTQTLGSLGFTLGFDLTMHWFYFSFGVGEYTLFYTDPSINTIGYKFQFKLGVNIDIPKLPLMQVYFLYRVQQLDTTMLNRDLITNTFGYYSRNIGAGMSVNVWRGIDVGFDLSFTLLHTLQSYPTLLPQFFVKIRF